MTWRVVLVADHGGSVDRPLADAFTAAGAEVVGFAGPLVPDVEAAVDRLAGLVDRTHGTAVLVGHAIGGMAVVRCAQRYPGIAAGLVLSAPVLGPWPMLDLLAGLDDLDDSDDLAGSADLDDSADAADVPGSGLRRDELAAIDECLTTIDFDHPLGDDLPALWVHGTDDTRVPMADTRAGLDRVRGLGFAELIVPGAGHDVLDSPGVRAEIVRFASQVPGVAGVAGSGPGGPS